MREGRRGGAPERKRKPELDLKVVSVSKLTHSLGAAHQLASD